MLADRVPQPSKRDASPPAETAASTSKILVIDDDQDINRLLATVLRGSGYQVLTATTGSDALLAIEQHAPAVAVLDLMLPDVSGIELCRRLHAHPVPIGIIILTAREDDYDRVLGFESGADDYLTKPPSLIELPYRVAALVRRIVERREQRAAAPQTQPLEAGPVRMLLSRHQVYVYGREVALRPLEFVLLQEFLSHPGITFSREQLLDRVWQQDRRLGARTVDVHIRRLRAKLGEAAFVVETVPGEGYRLAQLG